jgi:hypothetical protein
MKRKTNFDQYLEEQLKNEDFADRFNKAGEAWNLMPTLNWLTRENDLKTF